MWLYIVIAGCAGFVAGSILIAVAFIWLLGKTVSMTLGQPVKGERVFSRRGYPVYTLLVASYPSFIQGREITLLHGLAEVPGRGLTYFVVDQNEVQGDIPEVQCTIRAEKGPDGNVVYSFKSLPPGVTTNYAYRGTYKN